MRGLLAIGTWLWAQAAAGAPAAPVDFAREVRPILEARCHSCHGPDKRKGGLRLDQRTAALTGGDSGPAFVPGKAADSELLKRVSGAVPDDAMPPEGERLTAAQIEILRRWIDGGAPWPEDRVASAGPAHWAFRKPVRPAVPATRDRGWVRNPIDAFVLAALEARAVRPSPEADRHTLARRLSLDLTGLPPTADEARAFVADKRPDADERYLDRLLASPHFGEQWARHWLDLARYADSDGYEKDYFRPHAWRWRNWVIDSLNRDQPFDAFTRDQIAGDLLPSRTVENLVATGFHRNSLLNREGGVDIEEDRTKIVVDRVSTVGTAWLGLTVGCAECHSHKYDPITQREFYQLYAFFNSVDDREVAAPLDPGAFGSERNALERAKEIYVAAPDPALDAWAATVAKLPDVWHTPRVEDYDLPTFGANNGANLYPQEDGSFLVTGMVDDKTHYIMMLNTKLRGVTGVRIEALADEMLPGLGPGHAPRGAFLLNEVQLESASLGKVNELKQHRLVRAAADHAQPGFPVSAAIDGAVDGRGWAVDMPELPVVGIDRCAVLSLGDRAGYGPEGMRLKVSLVQHHGKSHSLGRLRVSYTTADPAALAGQAVPQRIREIARTPAGRRALDERVTLKRYHEATFRPGSEALAAFSRALAEAPGVKGDVRAQVVSERTIPRPTHVHVRGNFLEKGPAVPPGAIAALHPLAADGRPTRLDLARWLVAPENPLTARVTVNQIWRHLFGEGLVATPGDFGTQGEKPTHPELLDWLATELPARGWSRKALIKLIVGSSTYRQSSAVRTDLLSVDSRNRWLARQNRFRLSAENVRDQALAASGLLDRRIGGASVKPDVRRRGMYLELRRSKLDYMLTSFDAPGTTQACPKRERSNTPLQALTLMNDELYVSAARALGRRARNEASGDGERLVLAFRLALTRAPDAGERTSLLRLLGRARAIFAGDTASARKLGDDRHERRAEARKQAPWSEVQPSDLAPRAQASRESIEDAAWTAVTRAILNLDELVTRE